MVEARKNIELKARCADLRAAREAALVAGARVIGVLNQIDTYFVVPHGRLKLREINGERAELIQRPSATTTRTSARVRITWSFRDGCGWAGRNPLCRGAGASWGSGGSRRELLMYHNVRIHLDDVQGLGAFLEFEAVVSPADSDEICHQPPAGNTFALRH